MNRLQGMSVAVVVLLFAMVVGLWGHGALAETHAVPYFSAASRPWQGFARVINHEREAGVVEIHAIDDEGRWFGPAELSIGAGQARQFSSDDLEHGNATLGWSGIGRGSGDWRLELDSPLDITVLAYVRSPGGFLAPVHDISPFDGKRHWVPTFNPGSNIGKASRLRITNPGGEEAAVRIVGTDDRGARAAVRTTVPASASATLSARELEDLGLGNGAGKWRLAVESDEALVVMHFIVSPSGYLTNLSSVPELVRVAGPSRMVAAVGTRVVLRSVAALALRSSGRPTCAWTQHEGSAVELHEVDSERVRFTVPALEGDGATLSFRADCASAHARTSDMVYVDVVPRQKQRTLSALVDYADVDTSQRPLTLRDLTDLLSDAPDSLEHYLEATSRGRLDVEFDVIDWVTLDKRRDEYPLGGETVINDVVAKLSEVADLSAYEKVFPAIYPLEQGYPGCAADLEPRVWQTPNGEFRLGAAWLSGYDMSCVRKGRHAHEYAHMFGFGHSYKIECHTDFGLPASTVDPLDASDSCYIVNQCANEACTIVERGDAGVIANGDPDMLGDDASWYYEDQFPMHLHAVWQAKAGWLSDAQVVVAGFTRSAWLTSLETLTPTPKAIRVPLGLDHTGAMQSYWLETRLRYPQTPGWESTPCTLHVRLEASAIAGFPTGPETTTYRFESQRGFTGAGAGYPLHDPYRGVAVEVLECVEDAEETAVRVLVRRTQLEVSPPVVAAMYGGIATVSVRNNGEGSVEIGRVSVGGRDAGSFSIVSDTCSEASLAGGEACAVGVRAAAGAASGAVALLRIPNDDELIAQAAVTLFRW